MTREFPDELFTAYLDGELDAAQSEMVERHLAASESDRQLVAELKSVREGLKKLPRQTASRGFTDRVVAAAIATQPQNPGFGNVPGSIVRRRVLMISASVGAAIAATVLVLMQPWRREGGGTTPVGNIANNGAGATATQVVTTIEQSAKSAADQLVAAIGGALPDGNAAVIRVRLGKDVQLSEALSAALAQAGIETRGADDMSTGYRVVEQAYSRALDGKESLAAADALMIEAPLAKLQEAFASLGEKIKDPLKFESEMRLAYVPPRGKGETGEGEGGSKTGQAAAAAKAFVQRLSPTVFKLEKKAAAAASGVAKAATNNGNPPLANLDKPVRVLLLIEHVE